jgi:transcriptional regulator with XRE-family HTH domain
MARKRSTGETERDGEIGRRIRAAREARGIGLREFARRLDVSASLISQIELGMTMPSVGTLYAIANELDLSLDGLVSGGPVPPANGGSLPSIAGRAASGSDSPVVRAAERTVVRLASGVTWERLTPETERGVDFLYVTYDVGGASCSPDSLMRHPGKEYGHVLSGRLGVTVGFETHELGPGDAIAFESSMPHRLFCIGDEEVRAVWCVIGRQGDPRMAQTAEPVGTEA